MANDDDGDGIALVHIRQLLDVAVGHVRSRADNPSFLLAVVQKFILTPSSIHDLAAVIAMQQLWPLKSRLKGDPLSLYQLQLRIIGQIGPHTEQGRLLTSDLIECRLPTLSKRTGSSQHDLAVLQVRTTLYALLPDLSLNQLDTLFAKSISCLKVVSASDKAISQKLTLSLHQALWKSASAIEGDECCRWYSLALQSLLQLEPDTGSRFYTAAFRVPQAYLIAVNLEILDDIDASSSRRNEWNILFLRWVYRLAHTAFLACREDLIKTRLIPFLEDRSNIPDQIQLLHLWKMFVHKAALPVPPPSVTSPTELTQDVLKRCVDWCRSQLETNVRGPKNDSTLIPIASLNYERAVFLSTVFEYAASVLHHVESAVRAIQCRFSLSADHDHVLHLIRVAHRLLQSSGSESVDAVLYSSIFNACAILFNSGSHDAVCIQYLIAASDCFCNSRTDPKKTELWCKVLEMSAAVLYRQETGDVMKLFAAAMEHCRSGSLPAIMKSFVSCNLRYMKLTPCCSADLLTNCDHSRLVSLLTAELECFDGLQDSGSIRRAKLHVQNAITKFQPSAESELQLAQGLLNNKQHEEALVHARNGLKMTDKSSSTCASVHTILAAILRNRDHDDSSVEVQSHLDDAITIWANSDKHVVSQASVQTVKTLCADRLKTIFENPFRFVQPKPSQSQQMTSMMMVLEIESQLDRCGHVPLLRISALILAVWASTDADLDADSVAFLLEVLSDLRLEHDCPGSISSLPLVVHPNMRAIILQNASNKIGLRSMKSACDSIFLPRLCYAMSLLEYRDANLVSALSWAAQAVHNLVAVKVATPLTLYRLKFLFYHIAKLSEMTGNHSQGYYYYNQCLNLAKSQGSLLYVTMSLCGLAHIQSKRRRIEETERLLSEIRASTVQASFQFSSVKAVSIMIEGDLKMDPQLYDRALQEQSGLRTRARILRRAFQFSESLRTQALRDLEHLLPQMSRVEKARTLLAFATNSLQSLDTSSLWNCPIEHQIDKFKARPIDSSPLSPNCSVGRVRQLLQQAWTFSSNAPMPDFRRRLMMAVADVHGRTEPAVSAWALNSGLGISVDTEIVLEKSLFADSLNDLADQFSSLSLESDFETSAAQFDEKWRQSLPSSWNVLTMVTSTSHLFMCRLQSDRQPVVVRLSRETLDEVVAEFDFVMERNKVSARTGAETESQKRDWWSERYQLDRRLRKVVNDLENRVLGVYKGLLCSHHSVSKSLDEFRKRRKFDQNLAEALLKGFPYLTEPQLESVCCQIGISDSERDELRRRLSTDTEEDQPPLILVLDEVLQRLPWESMTCLKRRPVYRLPSIAMLAARMASKPLDLQLSFYVLNPGNDLPHTQARLENEFRSRSGWKGIIGLAPSKEEFREALTVNDLFVYCGHSSGEQYFGQQELRRIKVRPASLLLGCSSGMLRGPGLYEPRGTCLAYLQAGCPAVLGNLWDVTDCDIDRFSQALLRHWIDSERYPDLCSAMARARSACKLSLLNGAAPVCYGVPVYSHSKQVFLQRKENVLDRTAGTGSERQIYLQSVSSDGSSCSTVVLQSNQVKPLAEPLTEPVQVRGCLSANPPPPAVDTFKTPKPLTRSRRVCPRTAENIKPCSQVRASNASESSSSQAMHTPRRSKALATPGRVDSTSVLNTPSRLTRSMTGKLPPTPASKMR